MKGADQAEPDPHESVVWPEKFSWDPDAANFKASGGRVVLEAVVDTDFRTSSQAWNSQYYPRVAMLKKPGGEPIALMTEVAREGGGVPSMSDPRYVKVMTPDRARLFILYRPDKAAEWEVRVASGPNQSTTIAKMSGNRLIAPPVNNAPLAEFDQESGVTDLVFGFDEFNNWNIPPQMLRLAMAALVMAIQSAADEERGWGRSAPGQ